MRVLTVEAANFMRWDRTQIDLPDAGVVVVTGRNGHGKSTLIEAVAHAVWGRSVRGTPGWRVGEVGGVEVGFEGGKVRRNVSEKGVVKLAWELSDDGEGGRAMRRHTTLMCMAATVCFITVPAASRAENWPGWRGPTRNGVSSETGIPVKWTADEGVTWKTPVPGSGISNPVIWNDRIFLTASDGHRRGRRVGCFSSE